MRISDWSSDVCSSDLELLIPAALEGQLNEHNANSIRAKIVIEGAHGPTTPEADDILTSNGTLIVPDVLANAGGVTVSYFEWVQDFSSRSEAHTSELQSLMRISSAVFFLQKKKHRKWHTTIQGASTHMGENK